MHLRGVVLHLAVAKHQWYHFRVGAPPILVYFSGWIGMFTGGTIWILTHGHLRALFASDRGFTGSACFDLPLVVMRYSPFSAHDREHVVSSGIGMIKGCSRFVGGFLLKLVGSACLAIFGPGFSAGCRGVCLCFSLGTRLPCLGVWAATALLMPCCGLCPLCFMPAPRHRHVRRRVIRALPFSLIRFIAVLEQRFHVLDSAVFLY